MLLLWPVLDQRTDRYDEKAPKEPECREQPEDGDKRQSGNGKQESENRDTRGAERNKAILDFSAGEIASREAAEADADGNRGLQKTTLGSGDVQDVPAVENDIKLEKCAEKEEVGISDHGQPQHAVLRDAFAFAP